MGNYIGPDPNAQRDTQNRVSYVAADGQATFSATYTPGYIDVYQNGIKLQNTDFTALTGSSFTLGTACAAGDVVEYVAIKASSPYDFYTKAQADLRSSNFYGVALGTGDAMTVTLTPTPSALADGMEVKVRTPASNTAVNPSLTIMVLGVSKTIYKFGGQPILPGEWGAGQEITLRYCVASDRFELISNTLGINKTTLADATNIVWDINQGVMATLTLGGNRIFNNPSNLKPGTYILFLKQDATGSRTITSWGSAFKWVGAVVPTLSTTANSTDILSFVCDGTYLYGSISRGFA